MSVAEDSFVRVWKLPGSDNTPVSIGQSFYSLSFTASCFCRQFSFFGVVVVIFKILLLLLLLLLLCLHDSNWLN